jgi:O-antigen/teichoic acid export membrane protein
VEIRKIQSFLLSGDERTKKAKINIFFSFLFKVGSIISVFLLVPMTIKYLNVLEYGLWITITSLVSWLSLFDIGLGNGLRNKLTESLAADDIPLGQIYVSTTYFAFTAIVILILFMFFIVNLFIDWGKVFNTPSQLTLTVNKLVVIVMVFFAVQFILKLIITILVADQKPAYNDIFSFLSNASSVVVVWVLTKLPSSSLLSLGTALSIVPVIILCAITVVQFSGNYRKFRPTWRGVQVAYLKSLTGLGIKFFIIQISTFLIFGSGSIILTQLIGPEAVTPYNVVFRYFSVVSMIYAIILSPVWTGFTDAYCRQDFIWIRSTIKKLKRIALILSVITIVMILSSNLMYDIWLGKNRTFEIPLLLSATMGIYIIVTILVSPYIYFLNGVGKINLQMILSCCTLLTSIPISIFMIRYMQMGVAAVVIGPIVSLLPFLVLMPIQYYKIINNKASGIWNH